MTNSDAETLATLRDYLDSIPSDPSWDRKINIIRSIVGPAVPKLADGGVVSQTLLYSEPHGTITQETYPEFKIHFKYRSSDGENYYDIFEDQDKDLTCSCPGFKYRHTCRHVTEFRETRGQARIVGVVGRGR